MVEVSWQAASQFTRWASQVSGLALELPTEAQWEYAARSGGQALAYPWGNRFDPTKCVHSVGGEPTMARTASLERSDQLFLVRFGGAELLDMVGNVWQWCQDWYEPYPAGTATNPKGPKTGTLRVARGGAWLNKETSDFRCCNRGSFDQNNGDWFSNWGLRLAATVS